MNLVLAVLAAAGVFLIVRGRVGVPLGERVRVYLDDPTADRPPADTPKDGLDGNAFMWVLTGMAVGVLVAQGDLFLSGPGRSAPALAILGGVGGWFLFSARRTTLREREALRLRNEIPVVADLIALHVLTGESVTTAIQEVAAATQGVASGELGAVTDRIGLGDGVADALAVARASSAHPDASRLYEVLAHAHASGGRLADQLTDLAADLRSRTAADLQSEGGKRAVASYGPILALMVPTALLFLLYPTLLGLRTLAGSP